MLCVSCLERCDLWKRTFSQDSVQTCEKLRTTHDSVAWVQVWTLTRPVQHLLSFLFRLLSCRFVAVLGITSFSFRIHILFCNTSQNQILSSQIKWVQIITSPPPCLRVGLSCWYVVHMKCLVFIKHGHGPFRSCLSKGHCSRNLLVYLDATLQS